jgi:hypothetical protein
MSLNAAMRLLNPLSRRCLSLAILDHALPFRVQHLLNGLDH